MTEFRERYENASSMYFMLDVRKKDYVYLNRAAAEKVFGEQENCRQLKYEIVKHRIREQEGDLLEEAIRCIRKMKSGVSAVYKFWNAEDKEVSVLSNMWIEKKSEDGSPELLMGISFRQEEHVRLNFSMQGLMKKKDLEEVAVTLYGLPELDKDILKLSAKGLTNRKIGNLLHKSGKTIKNRKLLMYELFGVHSVTELLMVAVNAGFFLGT